MMIMIWMVVYTDFVSLQPCVSKAIGVAFYHYLTQFRAMRPFLSGGLCGLLALFFLLLLVGNTQHMHNTNNKQRAKEKTNKQSVVK